MTRTIRYRPSCKALVLFGFLLGLPVSAAPRSTTVAAPVYDMVIRGGLVFDGTGGAGVRADVAIDGDRIVRIGALGAARGRIERNATGLYVTPGFISLHDHTQPDSYARPTSLLTQGITTAITNPDGGGPLDIVAQLGSPGGLGLNYGAYLGFNSVWKDVMGMEERRATPDDIARMQGLVRTAMEQGAFGLSSGLDYKPGYWATTDEVAAVARATAPWRTNFPNHERVYPGNGYSSLAGMQESIAIGEKAGVTPVITHMKLQGGDQGKTVALFAMVHAATSRGRHVGIDAYPYTFGNTDLEQLLIPAWAQQGGLDAMLRRFADPALRRKIVAETEEQMDARWGGAAGVFLPDLHKELTAIIAEMGGIRPGEAVIRLLEQGERRVILRFGTEQDLERILADPLTAISCDCGARTTMHGHPRQWGSYPRLLGRYVRERRLLGWGEAVRKMTALPATMVGFAERGYLMPGMIADITIFDPRTVADRATIEQPLLPSVGIHDVIINGRLALVAGQVTDVSTGVRLSRSRHEPTRPMNFEIGRSLTAQGRVGSSAATVTIDLAQRARAARPTGTVRIEGLSGQGTIIVRPSILQTSEGWASVTGMTRWSDGREQAITILVEQADPQAHSRPSLTLLASGQPILDGALPDGSVHVRQGEEQGGHRDTH